MLVDVNKNKTTHPKSCAKKVCIGGLTTRRASCLAIGK